MAEHLNNNKKQRQTNNTAEGRNGYFGSQFKGTQSVVGKASQQSGKARQQEQDTGLSCCVCAFRKQRVNGKKIGPGYQTPRPITSDPLHPAKSCLLKVLPSQRAPPNRDQVFTYMSL